MNKSLSSGCIRPSFLNLQSKKIILRSISRSNFSLSSYSSIENSEELNLVSNLQYDVFVDFYNSNKNKQNNLICVKFLKKLISNQKIKKIDDILIDNVFNKVDLDRDEFIDLNEFVDLICIFFYQPSHLTHINERILRKYENDIVHNKLADISLK